LAGGARGNPFHRRRGHQDLPERSPSVHDHGGPEGFDPAGAFAEYEHNPAVQRWEALMRTLQEPLPGAKPGQWWTEIPLIFDLAEAS
jgi:hypothetical protein